MDFKFVYIFGFFFLGVKSKSLFPGLDSFSLPGYDSTGTSKTGGDTKQPSEARPESAWDKMMKMKDKYQPAAAEKFSSLKDKLPKDWKNPLAKNNEEEPDFGLADLFSEKQKGDENPNKQSFLDKLNANEGLNRAKDAVKNLKWPSWPKKNLDSGSPEPSSDADHDPYGLPDLFGEGDENPEKKSFLDKLKANEGLNHAKDAVKNLKWPSWPKKNPDSGSPEPTSDADHDPYGLPGLFGEGDENPDKQSFLDKLKASEGLNHAKDAVKNLKWPSWPKKNLDSGSPEPSSDADHDPYGLPGLFGEGDENPDKQSFLDKLKANEGLNHAKDAVKNLKWPSWPKKNHDSESPEPSSNDDHDPYGLPGLFGEDDENSDKQSFLDKLKANEGLNRAKNAVKNLKWPSWPKKKTDPESPEPSSNYEDEPYGLPDLFGQGDKNPDKQSVFDKLIPQDKLNQAKDAVKNAKWPSWPKKHHDSKSPEGSSNHDDEPYGLPDLFGQSGEKPDKQSFFDKLNPKDNLNKAKDAIKDVKWPSLWGKKTHDEEPSNEDIEYDSDENPGQHGHEKKESEQPKKTSSHGPGHGNHKKDHEPAGSPEKHGETDTSDSDPLIPGWFANSDENNTSKASDEESEEQYGNPEQHHSNAPHHKGKHDKDKSSGEMPDIPSWFWSDGKKEPEPEAHHKKQEHKHPQLLQEIYDVRSVGDNDRKTAKPQGKRDSDGEEDEDDDDGSSDQEGDGNETEDYNTDDDNDIGHEKNDSDEEIDPDKAAILKELEDRKKSKPKRESDDEADDDSSDSDDDDDDDDDENGEIFDNVEKDFSIWKFVLPMVAKNLPSIPNPFSVMNRMTVSFASINDLQRDPEYLQKSLIKKVNQKYKEKNENTLPGTTITFWPPSISTG